MADKNGVWAFVLKILVQILNFILAKMGYKSKSSEKPIEYKKDEQENTEMKEKVNNLIKDKLNGDNGK